jgi:hypothetical protein
MIRTGSVRALRQLANQNLRPLEREDPTASMSAHMQPSPTLATAPIFNFQHQLSPRHILRQPTSHDPCLLERYQEAIAYLQSKIRPMAEFGIEAGD